MLLVLFQVAVNCVNSSNNKMTYKCRPIQMPYYQAAYSLRCRPTANAPPVFEKYDGMNNR